MTNPRDDITGLSERLRQMPSSLNDACRTMGEAATALDALQEREKAADFACQRLCGNYGFATGHGDSIADMVDEINAQIGQRMKELEATEAAYRCASELLVEAESRATRAEQERDEALERAAKAVPSNWLDPLLTGDKAGKLPLDCDGVERLLKGAVERIRQLKIASGPDKEKRE